MRRRQTLCASSPVSLVGQLPLCPQLFRAFKLAANTLGLRKQCRAAPTGRGQKEPPLPLLLPSQQQQLPLPPPDCIRQTGDATDCAKLRKGGLGAARPLNSQRARAAERVTSGGALEMLIEPFEQSKFDGAHGKR